MAGYGGLDPRSPAARASTLVRVATPLSWALQETVVQTCGTAFWYKEPLRQLLARAGVPAPLIEKYWAESKYPMVRAILAELDSRGDPGILVQRRIVQELASIRRITDSSVDRMAAMEAIRALREAASEEGVLEDRSAETVRAKERRSTATARLEAFEAQQKDLARLCDMYGVLATRSDIAQQRGYDLEDLIGDLFKLYGIPYHPPYRKGTVEQTDGFFTFNGFQYLIEARWRKSPPPIGELRSFSLKVEAKIESTRGLFVSVAGFREEVLEEARPIRNLIYVNGQDLALMLEARPPLPQALTAKINQAAQRGIFFHPL
jgi:restriction endonuclease